jgi:hypothetical protein
LGYSRLAATMEARASKSALMWVLISSTTGEG